MDMEEILCILTDDRNMRPRPQVALQIVNGRSSLEVSESHVEADILACSQGLLGSESHAHASRRGGPSGGRIERNRRSSGSFHLQVERLDVVPPSDGCEVSKEAVITSMGKNMSDTEYVAVRKRGVNMIKIGKIR